MCMTVANHLFYIWLIVGKLGSYCDNIVNTIVTVKLMDNLAICVATYKLAGSHIFIHCGIIHTFTLVALISKTWKWNCCITIDS